MPLLSRTWRKFYTIICFLNKKAFSLSNLLDTYCSFLPQEIRTRNTTSKLQHKLKNHYGDHIDVQTQRGQSKSNMIFSSSISVSEAIRAASSLKADSIHQEDQILHDVAKILRSSLQSFKISAEFYPSSSEVSIPTALQFIPTSLINFLARLIDGNYFHIETDYNSLPGDTVRKCIALVECVIFA